MKFAPLFAGLFMSALATGLLADVTSDQLWQQYTKSPNTHPNIPNCSYAGYALGEKPLPSPKVVANVKDSGAKGDGQTDDTAAFAAALKKASETPGGGAVLVPAGTYRIEGMLKLSHNNVVLRGEGQGQTTLDFINPLSKTVGPFPAAGGKSGWSWSGGLVWIGPADTFNAQGKLAGSTSNIGQPQWEYWQPGKKLSSVTVPAKSGDLTVNVDNASALKPGETVLMTWANPADLSLLKAIAGHPAMDAYNWASATWLASSAYPRFQWPVTIAAVKGNQVTLKQPLRLDIRPEWKVEIAALGSHVTEAGIEKMTLLFHAPRDHKHLTNQGHNAIFINRALNCFVNDVEIRSTENGINLSSAKNVTVSNVTFTGPEQHHHTLACRVNSHDNLFENFTVDGPARVKHGINTEWLSSGNVWRKGTLKKGTFDSHRAMSFDSIRTDITIANDADGPGGDGAAGPFLGKRIVHWNIRIENSPRPKPGEFIFQPELLPMGAIVGIQGAPLVAGTNKLTAPGDKGAVVADPGKKPAIADLYEAQLKLRLGK